MAEAASSASCLIKHLYLFPLCLFVTGNNHLSDALTVLDNKRIRPKIYENNTHLATVVGIYGARSIQYCYTTLQGKSASWTHLSFEALGQREEKARRNQAQREDGILESIVRR